MAAQTHDSTPHEGEMSGQNCLYETSSAKLLLHSILATQLSVQWHDLARRVVSDIMMQLGSHALVSGT